MLSSGPVRVLTVGLLAALLAIGLPAASSHAENRTVSGGRLDWGIKASFQSYVTGPIANGSWSLIGGAATVGQSNFRFHSAQGTYDPDSGAFSATFSGGVRFIGHRQSDGSHQLELTISRPRVSLAGGGGTLYADVTSKDRNTGKTTSASGVPFASLNIAGVNMRGGSTAVQLQNVPATLTAEGAKSFAGYYTAGTPLDPLTLSADIRPAQQQKPDPKPSDNSAPKKKDKRTERSKGGFEDAAVDWGVRRTFREYVTGPVAQGRWRLSAGAQDGGALFRFPDGTGGYDPKKGTLEADFTGRIRFTGEQLDLALSGVAVRVEDGSGTLSADVSGSDFTGKDVPLVTFPAESLKPKDGLVNLREVPTKLTREGAEAFGGMYRAGSSMDPVSLAVALDKKAELPALPDLGSADDQPTSTPKAALDGEQQQRTTSTSSAAGWYGGGAAALLALGGAFALIHRRRSRRPSPAE
ncbi:HtaA domain-containing protein [Streptomyces sp. TP-A0874]|uniref:HtaA domain-containing protein n=1 Tax=Streptomyces sp. TP-A0874 TaxID=549819 RepID=UPI0008531AC3|nr:HtaA domain-containing protein [Streptomyces sp. TP-A0874]